MNGFLNQVATHLLKIHGDNLSQLTLVFPNRRGGMFFTNYLNSLVSKPLISPRMITINELFSELSILQVPDRLSLIFRLYKVYCESTHSTELFDDFYFWGEMLLSDFDQVDKYLVNGADLFTNITELKQIDIRFGEMDPDEKAQLEGFWKTLSDKDKTPNQREFVRLWEDILGVYNQFKAFLLREGIAYEGMLYRQVVERKFEDNTFFLRDHQYAFIGFNALNRCEECLFDHLRDLGKGTFFWDYDNYYLDDQRQEAGYFLRKNLARYPHHGYVPVCNSLTEKSKSIKIVNIASQVGQAQVAALVLLEQANQALSFDDTAVVLCDEELLLPMINALPENNQKVNVTMGYPLKMTPVFSLITQLIALQKNIRQQDSNTTFYNKDVMRILNHQLVIDFDPMLSKSVIDLILKNNLIYLSGQELAKNVFFSQLFVVPTTILELSDYFLEILKTIFNHWQQKENQAIDFYQNADSGNAKDENSLLYCEYLYQSYLAVNKLKDILIVDGSKVFERENFISKEAFFRFLSQYLSGLAIPFEGEPLEGLQIMGILETRTLDFKNLIILSMNDGVMPKITSSGSFIPYNLRRVFGLPTIEEQNAMYAYYFYRLLQRADNVTFVYNSSTNGMFTGEKSRYLYQLQFESPYQISETNMVFNVEHIAVQSINIEKSQEVMANLNLFLTGEKKLSPSALDKYLTCPLQFYFRYSAGLNEPKEISEEIDPMIFGLLFHDVMDRIYQPFKEKIIDVMDFDVLLKDELSLNSLIYGSFQNIYNRGVESEEKVSITGRNWLIFEVVKKYVKQLLKNDQQRAPFQIMGLENQVGMQLPINNYSQNVHLGGTIDRIDRIGMANYIVDYKSGKAKLEYLSLDSLFDREYKDRNKAAFQTLVYSFFMHKNEPALHQIYPTIYPLREIFEPDFNPSVRSKESGNNVVEFLAISEAFEMRFKNLVEEIFDLNIPFVQTTNLDNCKYCPYKQICRR
jgi:CRISPR/Cas system-associated exonuclease Cas4 (RecB family)